SFVLVLLGEALIEQARPALGDETAAGAAHHADARLRAGELRDQLAKRADDRVLHVTARRECGDHGIRSDEDVSERREIENRALHVLDPIEGRVRSMTRDHRHLMPAAERFPGDVRAGVAGSSDDDDAGHSDSFWAADGYTVCKSARPSA